MIKPKLYKECEYAFDCHSDREFKYLWDESNNQSVANELIIRNNITNEIVYQQKQETLLLKHILPANTLTNGNTYNVTIQVYDKDNVLSMTSDQIVFKCFTTPTLSLNIVQEQLIRNSSYAFEITYTQPENEELQYYFLELYDVNKNFIYSTNIKYGTESSTIITDLLDNSSYYIKAKGQTINHMSIETSLIQFHVEYIKPAEYAYITVENRYKYGDIQFTSFLVSIEGKPTNGTPMFNNGCIDTVNGTAIKFDENFSFDNGQLLLKGKNFVINNPFLILKNKKMHTMTFTWRYGIYDINNDDEKWYVELICKNGNVENIFMSNFITYRANDFYSINIKVINNYIDIFISSDGED